MENYRTIFHKLIPVFVFLLGLASPAQTVDLVSAFGSSEPIKKGDTFSVTVEADISAVNVTAVQIIMNYDPLFVRATKITEGNDWPIPFSVPSPMDNINGVVKIALGANLGETISESRLVATIDFEAVEVTNSTPITYDLTSIFHTKVTGNNNQNVLGDANSLIFEILSIDDGKPIEDKNAFILYPNPASSTINIIATEEDDSIKLVQISDLSARTVDSKKFSDFEQKSTVAINVSKYQNGIYIASITTSNGTKSQKKFIVNR